MNAIGYIIIAVLLVIVQGWIYQKFALRGVKIERHFEERAVFAGEEVGFHLVAMNSKLLPLPWLKVEQKLPVTVAFSNDKMVESAADMSYQHESVFSLLPFQQINRRYQIACLKRGYIELGKLTLSTTDLLGGGKYLEEVETPAALVVYPKLRDLRGTLIPANTNLGDFSVNRWIMEDPMMVTGIRDYLLTDSFRSVNWKATARNGKMFVNKYDHTADKKIMLFFNLEHSEFNMDKQSVSEMEDTIEVAASLAAATVREGIPVGFATNALCLDKNDSEIVSPDTGDKHISSLLEAFAKLTYYKRQGSRELLKMMVKDFSWGTEVVVVTHSISEQLMEDLQEIGHIRTTVIAYRKPSDHIVVPPHVRLLHYAEEGEKFEAV